MVQSFLEGSDRHEKPALLSGNQVHCESGPRQSAQRVPAGFPTSGFSLDHCSIKLLEIKMIVYMGKAFLKTLQANAPR